MRPMLRTMRPMGRSRPAVGGAPEIAVVTSPNNGAGGIRTDGPYNTGFKFTANSNMTVTKLGRTKITGNTGLWPIWLFVDGSCLPIAMAIVDLTSGVVGTTYYASLATPVSLVAGTDYFLIVDGGGFAGRSIGGDPVGQNWHEIAPIGTTTDISIIGSAYSIQDYLRNSFSVPRFGFHFQTPPFAMTVTQLGRFNQYPGASGTHTLRITDASGNTISSVSITNDGTIGFKYASLGTPLALAISTIYYIFSDETNGGDPILWSSGWANYNPATGIVGAAYSTGEGSTVYTGPANDAFGIVDVVYNSGTHLFGSVSGFPTNPNGFGYNEGDFKYHL